MAAPSPAPRPGRLPGETLAGVWVRRLLSIPLIFFLFGVGYLGVPLWLLLTGLRDLLAGRGGRAGRTRAALFFLLYLYLEVAGVLAAGLIWLGGLGGAVISRERWLAWNAALQRWWSGSLLMGAIRIFSMRLEVEGASEALPAPFLLWVRHTSTADTVLAANVLANPNRLMLRYVLKRELLWDPCLDIVGRRLPNAFVDRSGQHTEAALAAVADLGRDLDERSGVLIYPEGTRFSPRKRERALERLQAGDRPELVELAEQMKQVLPPRLGGTLALLEASPGVDVVVLAHTGFEGLESFASFVGGGLVGRQLRVKVWRIPATRIPARDRDRWVYERWLEVDAWVASAQTGSVEDPTNSVQHRGSGTTLSSDIH